MAAGQPLDLRERGIDRLRVEGLSAFEERFLVAEVADVRAAARDDDRVGHQVEAPLDQIAADRRQARQRPERRSIDARSDSRDGSPARNRGHVSSPGPMKIVSAWTAASSGSDVTCSPPSATYAPRCAIVVRDRDTRAAPR